MSICSSIQGSYIVSHMDEEDSYAEELKANVNLNDIINKDVTSTETNNLVCIEELTNQDIRNEETLEVVDNAKENLNLANKFEIVHGLPNQDTSPSFVTAKKDVGINIPINIANQELQSPVEDIQNNNIIPTTMTPTISTSTNLDQGNVSLVVS